MLITQCQWQFIITWDWYALSHELTTMSNRVRSRSKSQHTSSRLKWNAYMICALHQLHHRLVALREETIVYFRCLFWLFSIDHFWSKVNLTSQIGTQREILYRGTVVVLFSDRQRKKKQTNNKCYLEMVSPHFSNLKIIAVQPII